MTLLGKYIDDLDVNLDKTKLKTDISKLLLPFQSLLKCITDTCPKQLPIQKKKKPKNIYGK